MAEGNNGLSGPDRITLEEREEQTELTLPEYRREFPCEVKFFGINLWTYYFAGWVIGLALLAVLAFFASLSLGGIATSIVLTLLIAVLCVVAFVVDMTKLRASPIPVGYRAVPVIWGQMSTKISSGLSFRLPREKFYLIPTGMRQIEYGNVIIGADGISTAESGSIGILTNEGGNGTFSVEGDTESDAEGSAENINNGNQNEGMVIGWLPALNFEYPHMDEDLKAFMRNAPLAEDPSDIKGTEENIRTLTQEAISDIIRSVDQIEGSPWSYKKIMRERIRFDEGINKLFGKDERVLHFMDLLRLKNMTPTGKHTELPIALKNALNERAAAGPTGDAYKIKTVKEGEANAQVLYLLRKRIIDLWNEPSSKIGDRNIAIELEQFKTYVDSMKPGDKFVVSPGIISAFGQLTGVASNQGIGKEEIEGLIDTALNRVIAEKLSQAK